MEWLNVLLLIGLGIVLIVLEIIFVPGTTVVGILGFIFGGAGIFFSYKYFGTTTGTIVLVAAVLSGFAAIFYSFKSRAWERFSLREEHHSKYNDGVKKEVRVDDLGETLSSLKPFGKAIFNDQIVEVKSNGSYIQEKQSVRITKIESNKIIVEPIK